VLTVDPVEAEERTELTETLLEVPPFDELFIEEVPVDVATDDELLLDASDES
jgi:hypothetical protein